jgi:hypothetical protein
MKPLFADRTRDLQKPGHLWGFTIFIFLLCLANLLINSINHKFYVSDFKVYYDAAKNLVSGGKVYFIAFGEDSGFYKYSPLNLLFFLPYTLFPFRAAATLHFCLLSFSFWYTYVLVRRLLHERFYFRTLQHEAWLLSFAAICTTIFFVKELYLGNINIILIMLTLMVLKFHLEGKEIRAGIILALVLLTKPFFLLLLLPLMMRKKIRTLFWVVITGLAGVIIPFVVLGFRSGYQLTSDWINTMLLHNSAFPSMNSLDYIIRYYLWSGFSGRIELMVILVATVGIIWFIFRNILLEKGQEVTNSSSNLAFEWFFILALIPDIVKTDTEHFLATAPVITFIIYAIAARRRYWLIPLLVILIFFYGANSQDVLGKELSYRLFSMGLIGLSNLLIVLMAFLLFLDFRKWNKTE